ncbi:hypothetical protein BDV93DRAFT_581502 [Ceratobasidium sp. AG-I]|nr:hypothetical protein BDV93DRAFT_581502 [Ceratobasidium sp. AG-I]
MGINLTEVAFVTVVLQVWVVLVSTRVLHPHTTIGRAATFIFWLLSLIPDLVSSCTPATPVPAFCADDLRLIVNASQGTNPTRMRHPKFVKLQCADSCRMATKFGLVPSCLSSGFAGFGARSTGAKPVVLSQKENETGDSREWAGTIARSRLKNRARFM